MAASVDATSLWRPSTEKLWALNSVKFGLDHEFSRCGGPEIGAYLKGDLISAALGDRISVATVFTMYMNMGCTGPERLSVGCTRRTVESR
jgi:hypothetical protein